MVRKSLLLMIVVLALLSIGVLIVAAQEDEPTTPPFGQGMMGGMGGMMHRGMMMGTGDMPGMTAIAEALGMEPNALVEALHSGQTLAQIAEAQGVELQAVTDAMLAAAEGHVAELVAAGTLTQEQADEHLAYLQEHLAEMPMFSREGCAMMGGMGMMHHGHGGRMGRGAGFNS